MKTSILLEMIGDTDDSIIEEAKKREKPVAERLARWIAVAACLCLIVAAIVGILKLRDDREAKRQYLRALQRRFLPS